MEGTLVVGTSPEPGTRVGEIVAGLRAAQPLVEIDLRARASEGAWQGLRSGEVDVCVLLGGPVDTSFAFYELTKVYFYIAGPAAWRDKLEQTGPISRKCRGSRQPAAIPPIQGCSPTCVQNAEWSSHPVTRFDNAALGRALLQAGVGLMLSREEHLERGMRDGTHYASPLARVEYALSIAHQTSRKDDPLIKAFVAAASFVWEDMKVTRLNEPRLSR